MPVIRVSLLPKGQTENELNLLAQDITDVVLHVKELGLNNPQEVTCIFPLDQMEYRLGEAIIVEIFGLFDYPERNIFVKHELARRVGTCIKEFYPDSVVEVFVNTFTKHINGFWRSK